MSPNPMGRDRKMKRYALLLSGGTGSRIGGIVPKQYLRVNGRLIILCSLEALLTSEDIDRVWVVAAREWRDEIMRSVKEAQLPITKLGGFARPGINRQQSIINGMEKLLFHTGMPDENDLLLIHDAARPFLTRQMIHICFNVSEGHDGAMPVLPMKDTVYLSDVGRARVERRLERERVFAGQSPEVFRLKKYHEANQRLTPAEIQGIHGSSEPAVDAGLDIAMFPGDERNFKITTEEDLERARMLL